jgi:hypothetical protein
MGTTPQSLKLVVGWMDRSFEWAVTMQEDRGKKEKAEPQEK